MEFARHIISYVVKMIADKIAISNNLSAREREQLFLDANGNKTDKEIFLRDHINELDNKIISEVRNRLTGNQALYINDITFFDYISDYDYDYAFQYTWDYAIPFMTYFNILYNYNTPQQNEIIDYYSGVSSMILRVRFFEDGKYANKLLKNFLTIIGDEDLINDKLSSIKNSPDDYEVLKKWESSFSTRIDSINHILRNVIRELYDYYKKNYDERYVPSYISSYFVNDFDPIKRLEKLGVSKEEKIDFKKMMLRIMLSDLYEDSLNDDDNWMNFEEFLRYIGDPSSPLISIKSRNNANMYYHLVKSNKYYDVIVNDSFLRNALFYNYSEIISNRKRMADNRAKTISDDRVYKLSKINPYHLLDF